MNKKFRVYNENGYIGECEGILPFEDKDGTCILLKNLNISNVINIGNNKKAEVTYRNNHISNVTIEEPIIRRLPNTDKKENIETSNVVKLKGLEILDKTGDIEKIEALEEDEYYKMTNFRCPNCGQSMIMHIIKDEKIQTIGQTEYKKILVKIEKDICDFNKDKIYMLVNSITSFNEKITDIIASLKNPIFGTCPLCCEEKNIAYWQDAYDNYIKYFTYKPCYKCGGETELFTVEEGPNTILKCKVCDTLNG